MLIFSAGALWGCGSDDNNPPIIDPIPDRPASVGSELTIAIRATDPDGDAITFSYKADTDIGDRAQLLPGAGGTAVFKWVPIGADVGIHAIDFFASDGKDKGRRQVNIDVKSAAGGAGTPVFLKPLGTGSTLDLSQKTELVLPIEIADADSSEVQIGQEPPLIEGATIEQTGPLSGNFRWTPTPAQIDGGELFTLLLSAYDGENPKVLKDYLVVLQKGSKANCPGQGPVITHQPSDQSTSLDLEITADVTDDKGLKYPPLLLYSDKAPGAEPDLGQMTQLTMESVSGDLKAGKWKASIPNPVATQPSGATADVHYLIVATDNDDEVGDCDHSVRSPTTGAHTMTVTNSGSAGGLKECAACSSDVQCGGPEDNCIYVASAKVCGLACVDDFDCPLSHECSTAPVLSVGGKTSKQCIPSSGKCGGTTTTCVDDSYEENDVLADVKNKAPIGTGAFPLKSCPGAVFDDEDWFPIYLSAQSTVTVSIAGGSSSNLDLMLTDSAGKVIQSSAKSGSQESITACLAAGTYYFHVWAWSKAENSYTLTWSKQAGCAAACTDDSNEPDDNMTQARDADVTTTYKSLAQMICSNDDDWYKVDMYAGETLHATAKFTQTKSSEDLDLYLYDKNGVKLTKCSESDPFSCDETNGASGNSNENLKWSITTAGVYYVVVHGWEGSSNKYDMCIDYTSSTKTSNGCPPL